MKRKLFSTLLVLALALSLLPTAAFAEGSAEGPPACTCETACTAENMNANCSLCGAEDALPEDCGKYAAPVNGEESVTGTAITFPAPKAGDNIPNSIGTAAARPNTGSLTLYAAMDSLWEDGKPKEQINASYEKGCAYELVFRFQTDASLGALAAVTCNGQSVTLLTGEDAKESVVLEKMRNCAGTQDAFYAYIIEGSDGDRNELRLFALVHVPLTTTEVSTADALRTAIETGTDDIVKLTDDITISENLTVSRSVTLDLNDHVLTITGENQFITVSGKDTTMTLTDSVETKTERRFSINKDGAWVLDENGDQTVSGGVITGGKAGVDSMMGTPAVDGGVGIQQHGTLTVTGGTVNAPVLNRRGVIAGSGTFNGTVVNEDRITGGTFNGPVANYQGQDRGDNEISGGIFYGTVANGYNYYNDAGEETGVDGKNSGLITGGTFYGKVTNAFFNKITGGSFYGEVDNREGTYSGYQYRGTLAGGTFYAGYPGTVADGCCTVTYEYPFEETYAIQIVKKGETATRPADPVRSDFTFDNWYAYPYPDRPTQEAYDFDTRVEDDMFLGGNWVNTFYGIHITDKGGNVYNVTDKNFTDVLGDGTVFYVPGYANENTTYDDWKKALRGETVEGLQLPKLTLNGANLQQIEIDTTWISNQDVKLSSMMLQLELVGNNTVEYNGNSGAAISADYLIITGSGSLNVTAQGQNAKAIAVSSSGGGYYQYGGDVMLHGEYSGIYCSDAHFEFAAGKLTASSSKYALYYEFNDNYFKITSDTTTFYFGSSEETKFEINTPFSQENIYEQLLTAINEGKLYADEYGVRILYAQLTSNHIVTFDTDGGSAIDTQTVPYGGQAAAPAAPAKPGHTFSGWYLGEEEYDFTAPVTENMTLTARWTRSSSGGGSSGGSSSYPITAAEADHGTVTVSPKSASKGTTVTVTVKPDSGYTLETISAADKNGSDLKLTDKGNGKYTFTMPGGKVEVKAAFMEDNSVLNFFVDVPNDAYYFEPVKWAVDTGITGGTDALHFSPGQTCTRAQVVTFLWRAAGKPVVNFAMNFSDVDSGAYYAEAVRWAASLGIVSGYGNGRFGVGDPITREQTAAMLYRFAKAQGLDTTQGGMAVREFGDFGQVSPYAGEAMAWAVNAGILKGTDNRLLPKALCTRAQIVTFLYRALSGQ